MKKIYIVFINKGEYDENVHYVSKVFIKKSDAKKHVIEITKEGADKIEEFIDCYLEEHKLN